MRRVLKYSLLFILIRVIAEHLLEWAGFTFSAPSLFVGCFLAIVVLTIEEYLEH